MGLVPGPRQEVWNHIAGTFQVFDLVEIKLSKELSQTQNTLRRILLTEQITQASMIGDQLEMNTIQERTPMGEGNLSGQSLRITRIVTELRTLQLTGQEGDRVRMIRG